MATVVFLSRSFNQHPLTLTAHQLLAKKKIFIAIDVEKKNVHTDQNAASGWG